MGLAGTRAGFSGQRDGGEGSSAAAQPLTLKPRWSLSARVPADQRARSDDFEGGYWLLLWDFLSTVVVMGMMLRFRWSVRMRDLAERLTRFKALESALYWAQFVVLFAVIVFPLTVCEGYFREHKYGLSNQTFWEWMRDQLVGLALVAVLGALLVALLFGVVRRLGRNWWGSAVVIGSLPSW
jgi:STE24 endopeptidase